MWRKDLLPPADFFQREVRKLFKAAKDGHNHALKALEKNPNIEWQQAADLAKMILLLKEVRDPSIQDHLKTATLSQNVEAKLAAREFLERRARSKKPNRYFAEMAVNFFKLRDRWP